MKLIAHRGNWAGKKADYENNPLYVLEAIKLGYDVEIDLRMQNGCLWLGHDTSQYKIDDQYLLNNKVHLWVHAKNLDAVTWLSKNKLCWFWHQKDALTMTSTGVIWAYPEIFIENCVVNQPSNNSNFWSLRKHMPFSGFCADDFSKLTV